MSTSPEDLPEEPDTYEGAAETDPEHWRDDPLVRTPEAEVSDGRADPEHPEVPSEQQLRDETAEARYEAGDEQVPPEEPALGEALEDLDVPEDPAFEDEIDSSNDSFHGGGDPLS
ncbi:hypothetical protein ACH9EU_14225 [Kocuria sp. M1R5S2]|uniref:hypothetical protein n=1 Tax=Kocuria rhizosphaerae TaxID=3376285 RepID=UPI0037AE59FC